MMKNSLIILLLGLVITLNSCVSYDSLVNYNVSPEIFSQPHEITNFEPIRIQASDILRIQVSSTDPVAAAPFNLAIASSRDGQASGSPEGFLVNLDGTIDFPTLGSIKLENYTVDEARARMIELLQPYFTEKPIVNVRLLNFKINVNGEVKNPGIFNISNNRVTIIEALTLAGDFTDHSMRDSILIVRESEGVRSFGYVNFNSAEIFYSPYFYLQQNDMIYVRPETRKTAVVRDPATRVIPFVSATASVVAIILAVLRFSGG